MASDVSYHVQLIYSSMVPRRFVPEISVPQLVKLSSLSFKFNLRFSFLPSNST